MNFLLALNYMWPFSLFRKKPEPIKAKRKRYEKPSEVQSQFAKVVLEIIGPSVEKYGFSLTNKEVGKYFTNIVWRKHNQYVKVNSTNYPTDYPYYYAVSLGEGSSEDAWESDWNSVAVWSLARIINPEDKIGAYDFPYDQKFEEGVKKAGNDLLNYGSSFLNGDLEVFIAARKMINAKREPYKIHSPDENGIYHTRDEPKSAELKKKYS